MSTLTNQYREHLPYKVAAAGKLDQIHCGYLILITNGRQWFHARVLQNYGTFIKAEILMPLDTEDTPLENVELRSDWYTHQDVEVPKSNIFFFCTIEHAMKIAKSWRTNCGGLRGTVPTKDRFGLAPAYACYKAFEDGETELGAKAAAYAAGAV